MKILCTPITPDVFQIIAHDFWAFTIFAARSFRIEITNSIRDSQMTPCHVITS